MSTEIPEIAAVVADSASLWRRLAAALYDLFPLVALWMTATLLLLPFLADHVVARGSWWFRGYLVLVAFAYYGWSWQRGGQTIGMRAWRLRVRHSDGRALSWRDAAIRYLVAYISLGAAGLGLGWALIDARRRMWHDLAVDTEVIVLPKAALKRAPV